MGDVDEAGDLSTVNYYLLKNVNQNKNMLKLVVTIILPRKSKGILF